MHLLRIQVALLRNSTRYLSLSRPLFRVLPPYRLTSIVLKQRYDQRCWYQDSTRQVDTFSMDDEEVLMEPTEKAPPLLSEETLNVQCDIPKVEAYVNKLLQLIHSEHLRKRKKMERLWENQDDEVLKREGRLLTGMRGRSALVHKSEMISFYKNEGLPFHIFKRGDVVLFCSEDQAAIVHRGTVYEVGKRYLRVVSRTKLPDWFQGTWRLELSYSDSSYEKMREALMKLCTLSASNEFKEWYDPNVDTSMYLPRPDVIIINKNAGRLANRPSPLLEAFPKLKQWLDGEEELKNSQLHAVLNDEQLSAIKTALRHPVSTIQGAPGTGKTKIIAHIVDIIRQLEGKHLRILVCAHSNVAVDQVMEHMRRLGLKAVRIGPPGRINPNVWHMTLGERVKEHPMYDKFLGVHQSVNRKEKISETLHFDDEVVGDDVDDAELNRYFELRSIIMNDTIEDADVVCTTCIAAGYHILEKHKFALVIIDDASQCTETEALVPIIGQAKHVIFLGDTIQLEPHIEDEHAYHGGLGVSILQRMIDADVPNTTLTTQFRMHPIICRYPAVTCYRGQLKPHANTGRRKAPILLESTSMKEATHPSLIFVDLDDTEFGKEYKNDQFEIYTVVSIVIALLEQNPKIQLDDIGIITTNRRQRQHIQNELNAVLGFGNTEPETGLKVKILPQATLKDVQPPEVETIEGFQGREKPIIIFVPTFISKEGNIDAIAKRSRMLVGLTRAQRLLVVVGYSDALKKKKFWREWLNWLYSHRANKGIKCVPALW